MACLNPTKAFKQLEAGTYQALADGYIIGSVGFPNGKPARRAIAWISGQCADIEVAATGGNQLYYFTFGGSGKLHWAQAAQPNSFYLPINYGQDFTLSAKQGDDNEVEVPYSFSWHPQTEPDLSNSLKIIDSNSPSSILSQVSTSAGTTAIDDSDQHQIDDLMTVLYEIFQDRMSAEQGKRLRQAIEKTVFKEIHRLID